MHMHYLVLNCTQAETEYRLKQNLRVYPPKGSIDENTFKIYKRLPGNFVGRGVRDTLLCFYGNYQQSGDCTYLSYRIRPGFSILTMYTMLCILTLLSINNILRHNESFTSLLFILCFFLIFFLIIQIQKKKCKSDFEKRLND